MKFLKPSELPIDTVIEVDADQYIKQARDYGQEKPMILWLPLGCEDCQGTVSFTQDHADEAIRGYRIVSLPYKVTVDLVEQMTKGNGVPMDATIALMLKEYHRAEE
jgi:hypothetical protein